MTYSSLLINQQAVHHIMTNMKLVVTGKEWTIKPILTCNLKALMKLMGLYDVFHPKSKSKCPFCACKDMYVHKQSLSVQQ